jgi:hypothetical protein
MTAEVITCPQCRAEIPLTEAITHQIRDGLRKEFDANAIKLKENFERDLLKEKQKIEIAAVEKAKTQVQIDLDDLQKQILEKDEKIKDAYKKELEFRQKSRELEDREKQMDLEILKCVDEERNKIRDEAIKIFQDQFRLQLAERESKISSLSLTVDELQRKIAQGSQQLQGEVLEIELEELLHDLFPMDTIEPVAKGVKGADILQKIFHSGSYCGSVIWETKRAKVWHKDWIEKLILDQNDAKANIAVLYSTIFPKEMECFGLVDGVWITDYSSIPGLATALRNSSIELARERVFATGKNGKMEILYSYVNSSEFRQKVQGVADATRAMQEDLIKEKRAMVKIWAKREKQIQGVVLNTVRIVGDMQGIMGKSLQEMEVFELDEAPGSDE